MAPLVSSPTCMILMALLALVTAATPASTSARLLDEASSSPQPPPTPADHHELTFFMHDILGGTNPSARVVTGVVTNPAVNGQIPFAKPNGANLPINPGVAFTPANMGLINNNNVPFLTGLAGPAAVAQDAGGRALNGNGRLPLFAGGNLPSGSALQELLFGTMTVVDDELTTGHDAGGAAAVVGRAQGFYVASAVDGTSQVVALTAMFRDGEYADSLCLFGVHRIADSESHLAVVGGTGRYAGARGAAAMQIVSAGAQQGKGSDGVETLVRFTVYLD